MRLRIVAALNPMVAKPLTPREVATFTYHLNNFFAEFQAELIDLDIGWPKDTVKTIDGMFANLPRNPGYTKLQLRWWSLSDAVRFDLIEKMLKQQGVYNDIPKEDEDYL